jgi:DNA recombination protein RmuC
VTEILLVITSLLVVAGLVTGILILAQVRKPQGGELDRSLREEFRLVREESASQARQLREEVSGAQDRANESLVNTLKGQMNEVVQALNRLSESNRQEQDKARTLLDETLRRIQESNEKKLDQMRQTVDEKLHSTLEKRLGESFKLVSDRLEAVQRGLGEMKNLADGVGDLKRVLTNVKERGTWGEYQLGAILEQILTPDQYAQNVRPREGGEVVEFAVKLPGREDTAGQSVWLPIDAKFPREDYDRLLEAAERADAEAVKSATNGLLAAVRRSAKEIRDKYICPPQTTDFAIMFLATEGLYAEVLRQPGFHDELQGKYRVLATGPTTLSAILNSLRIGFQTLAIEQRSHEVWAVLAEVKNEFGKFGGVLDKLKKQLSAASNTVDRTQRRTRVMERRLRAVEQMPAEQAQEILALAGSGLEEEDEGEDETPEEADEE